VFRQIKTLKTACVISVYCRCCSKSVSTLCVQNA